MADSQLTVSQVEDALLASIRSNAASSGNAAAASSALAHAQAARELAEAYALVRDNN